MFSTIIPVTRSYGFPIIIRQEIAEGMVPTPDIQGGSSDVFGDLRMINNNNHIHDQ